MSSCWAILELDPTRDVSAIKRAYAERTKVCHPEENPEGFLRLRQAYQTALAYAGSGEETEVPSPDLEGAEPEDEGWTLTDGPAVIDEGPNPFADHPAAQAFLALYTGKQRKNPQMWMDYFTSGAFLDVAWERRFAGLLLEETVRLEECPVPREFLFRLAARGPAVKPLKSEEQAVSRSFADYRLLVRLAEKGRWTEERLKKAGSVLDFYMIGNFQDRNPTPSERHPADRRTGPGRRRKPFSTARISRGPCGIASLLKST